MRFERKSQDMFLLWIENNSFKQKIQICFYLGRKKIEKNLDLFLFRKKNRVFKKE